MARKRRTLTEAQKAKRDKGLCIEYGCGKKKAKKKLHCPKHYHQEVKLWQPLRYYFENHRCHAHARRIKWELTFKYFCKIVSKTDYLERRGREALSLSLDRKINKLGYVKGNVGVTTISWNAIKGNRMMYVPYFRNQAINAGYVSQESYSGSSVSY